MVTKVYNTLDSIKSAHRNKGLYFFSDGAIEFFNAKTYDYVLPLPDGALFITSERAEEEHPENFSVRRFHAESGQIDAVDILGEAAFMRDEWVDTYNAAVAKANTIYRTVRAAAK